MCVGKTSSTNGPQRVLLVFLLPTAVALGAELQTPTLPLLSPTTATARSPASPTSQNSSLQMQIFNHNETHGLVRFNVSRHPSLGSLHQDFHVPHELLHHLQPALHDNMENSTHGEFKTGADHATTAPSPDTVTTRRPKPEPQVPLSAVRPNSTASPKPKTLASVTSSDDAPSDIIAVANDQLSQKGGAEASESRPPPGGGVRLTKTGGGGVSTPKTGAAEQENADAGDSVQEKTGVSSAEEAVGNSTEIADNREAKIADLEKQQHFRITKFTVILCGVLALTLIILGGVWVHRFRRRHHNNRQLLDEEEDEEEFTVFNVIDRQYAAARKDCYYPLD